MNVPFVRTQTSIAAQHLCSGEATPPHAWLYNPYTPALELRSIVPRYTRYPHVVVMKGSR